MSLTVSALVEHFIFTYLSTMQLGSLLGCFLYGLNDRQESCVIVMKANMVCLEAW